MDTSSNATAERDVFIGPVRLLLVEINNTAGTAVYTKFYNNKTPAVGTTVPDIILLTAASSRRVFFMGAVQTDGDVRGPQFSNGLSYATVTTGGTGGTTSPGAPVEIRLTAV